MVLHFLKTRQWWLSVDAPHGLDSQKDDMRPMSRAWSVSTQSRKRYGHPQYADSRPQPGTADYCVAETHSLWQRMAVCRVNHMLLSCNNSSGSKKQLLPITRISGQSFSSPKMGRAPLFEITRSAAHRLYRFHSFSVILTNYPQDNCAQSFTLELLWQLRDKPYKLLWTLLRTIPGTNEASRTEPLSKFREKCWPTWIRTYHWFLSFDFWTFVWV